MQAKLPLVERHAAISLRYLPRPQLDAWVLPEAKVSESAPHDAAAQDLKLRLDYWAAHTPRSIAVYRNLAVRFYEPDPRVGIDPDVCVVEPVPPGAADLGSLRCWREEFVPPRLCFEIVSKNHPHKDYTEIQDRYAVMGTEELIVFDPLLVGPRALGGPVPLQHWRRDESGDFDRVAFGSAPVYSETLEAWVIAQGRLLVLARDRLGEQRWLTEAEGERAEKERERAEKERERAEKERERTEKERERTARIDLERRLAALESKA